jgi:hypothetical protein
MYLSYILTFCRIAIGLVFALSFIGKIRNVRQFEQTVRDFAILPRRFSKIAALLFLCGEFAVVVLVTLGNSFLFAGFALAACLLLIFSIALASVLARNMRTSCNCFGSTTKQVSPFDVWRNAGFILCALGGCGLLTASKGAQTSLGLVEVSLVGLGAAVFVAVWTQLSEITQLLRHS